MIELESCTMLHWIELTFDWKCAAKLKCEVTSCIIDNIASNLNFAWQSILFHPCSHVDSVTPIKRNIYFSQTPQQSKLHMHKFAHHMSNRNLLTPTTPATTDPLAMPTLNAIGSCWPLLLNSLTAFNMSMANLHTLAQLARGK